MLGAVTVPCCCEYVPVVLFAFTTASVIATRQLEVTDADGVAVDVVLLPAVALLDVLGAIDCDCDTETETETELDSDIDAVDVIETAGET